MEGVDLWDKLILQFEPQFKCLKIWRKLLFHGLVTAAGIVFLTNVIVISLTQIAKFFSLFTSCSIIFWPYVCGRHIFKLQ